MRFRDTAKLDTSQIDDERGRSGSRMGLPGGGLAIGGGAGIIGLLLALVLGFTQLSGNSGTTSSAPVSATQLTQECRTGADANTREDCRIVGVVNSVQEFWSGQFSARGQSYSPAQTTLFTDAVDTGCGSATSEVGRSTAPPTSACTSILASSTSCDRSSARKEARSPRPTSSRTSTAITYKIFRAR